MSSASPQIILGDPNTGIGSDDILQALGKYNIHTHAYAESALALLKGVRPGDSLQSVAGCNPAVFPSGTTVANISRYGGLVASANALVTTTCDLQVGTKTLYSANTTHDSNVITFQQKDGFVLGSVLAGYASKPVSLLIPSIQVSSFYPVLLDIPWYGILDRIVAATLSGTATIDILINSTVVSTLSLTTTPSVVEFQATAINHTYFNSGDNLRLQVAAASGAVTLHLSLYLLSLNG